MTGEVGVFFPAYLVDKDPVPSGREVADRVLHDWLTFPDDPPRIVDRVVDAPREVEAHRPAILMRVLTVVLMLARDPPTETSPLAFAHLDASSRQCVPSSSTVLYAAHVAVQWRSSSLKHFRCDNSAPLLCGERAYRPYTHTP